MADNHFGRCAIALVLIICIFLLIYAQTHFIFRHVTLSSRLKFYASQRNMLVSHEAYARFGGRLDLCESELRANERIMRLKRWEYEQGIRNVSKFKPSKDFLSVSVEIEKSPLYQLIRAMPKGGLLHTHDMALCSIDCLMSHTFGEHLWLCESADGHYEALKYANKQPQHINGSNCSWKLLVEMRKSLESSLEIERKLRERLTFKPTNDTNAAWEQLHDIMKFVEGLVTYKPVWEEYHFTALEEMYADGVRYVELRSALPTLYDLNGTEFNFIDTAFALEAAVETFKATYPSFIGAKLIYVSPRNVRDCEFQQKLTNALQLKHLLPDFFIGFDIQGQENGGRPLEAFAYKLLTVQDKIDFYLHAGATNWYGTDADMNLLDAIILGSKRISNGFALLKHPEAMRYCRAANVPVEISPVSDQVLHYVNDIRNHPGAYLFASGYPVIIVSEYPGLFKSTPLSHDIYLAFLGMASENADLRMLKMLGRNSLLYSALKGENRTMAVEQWIKKWDRWIDRVIGTVFI